MRPTHLLLRRALKAVILGVIGLTIVAVTTPHQPGPDPVQVPAMVVRPPIRWDALDEAIQAQGAWYAAASSKPVKTSIGRHSSSTGRHRGYATTAECIAAVENGGDYGRSSNPGHFGRYQYDRQTWIAHGGNPDDWGTASPEEQDRVFTNGVATYGTGAWAPYDGCG